MKIFWILGLFCISGFTLSCHMQERKSTNQDFSDEISTEEIQDSTMENCEIEKIAAVEKNIKNVNVEQLYNFLFSINPLCAKNAEYSQYFNEVLFLALEKKPDLFFEVVNDFSNEKLDLLIEQIENPVHDGFMLDSISNLVEVKIADGDIKEKIIQALHSAKSKL